MSTKTIGDYTAAVGIDASADYLLIEQSSVYKKINRNVMLGLASAPLGTTDSQSPTNKTFDNTNALTIKDSSLTLENGSDTSKKVVFSLSSISTSTTRTLTVPDASFTIVGAATTQTLTNKTLTSPTITGGTIDNSTITVDSIAGHSSSTVVTVANLQISNGVLNSANAVTSTSVAAGAIQPQALTSGTGTGWAWSTWSAVWTGLTPGSAVTSYKYIQVGKNVFFKFSVVIAGDSSLSGNLCLTLPVTATSISNSLPIGKVIMTDTGTKNYMGYLLQTDQNGAASTTKTAFFMGTSDSTYLYSTLGSSTVPFTAANADIFAGSGVYEAA